MFFKSVVAVAVALLTVSVSAQTTSANSTIDPATITLTTRNQWCAAQMSTCGTLCSGALTANTCDGDTLDYSCLCSANSSAPALALYTDTMPTFICEEIYKECIANNTGVASAQAVCNSNEKANCGHIDPSTFVAAVSSSSSVSTATKTSSTGESSATAASSSTSSGAAATMMAVGGQGMLIAGAAAAFGYLL